MRRARLLAPFLASFAAGCGGGEREGKRGGLQFEATYHDFGTLVLEDLGRHTYRAWNTGKAGLTLRAVKASCGCALPEVVAIGADGVERRGHLERTGDVLQVAPGETLEVRLLLDARRGVAGGVPEILGNLLLETDEAERPYLRLEFHARFDVPVNVSPLQVDVDPIGRNESVLREVLLAPTLGRAVHVSAPVETPPGVRAELESEEKEGPGGSRFTLYRLRLRLGPGLPEGLLSTVLRLPTDYRPGHAVEVPLRARVVGDVTLHPAAFEFGIVRRSAEGGLEGTLGRSAALRYTPSGRSLKPGEPRVDGEEAEHLRASVREIEAGRRYEILLEAKPGLAAPVFKGTVIVPTDDPENPEIRIPYRGFVREG